VEIYRGKSRPKTAADISERVHKNKSRRNVRAVLTIGNDLVKAGMVEQVKVGGRVAYQKLGWLDQLKKRILNLAANPKALAKLPTKVSPKSTTITSTVKLRVWGNPFDAREVTVDDIASFAKVRKVKAVPKDRLGLAEKVFKAGLQQVIGEPGKFVDWGGEKNDLLTTRVTFRGNRIATACAFKGPGQKGVLQPAKMGKNGNQIQKLFESSADLFIIQYWGQIGEPVKDMVSAFAQLRSGHLGKRVYYCIIDGKDSDRLVLAYPKAFKVRAE
jgi:hypothetical protein